MGDARCLPPQQERYSKSIMQQRAKLVMEKMREVYENSPVMTLRGHKIKAMVVLPTIQGVYDFGRLLRTCAKNKKTALGKRFVIGTRRRRRRRMRMMRWRRQIGRLESIGCC